jgi:hypothetical protein
MPNKWVWITNFPEKTEHLRKDLHPDLVTLVQLPDEYFGKPLRLVNFEQFLYVTKNLKEYKLIIDSPLSSEIRGFFGNPRSWNGSGDVEATSDFPETQGYAIYDSYILRKGLPHLFPNKLWIPKETIFIITKKNKDCYHKFLNHEYNTTRCRFYNLMKRHANEELRTYFLEDIVVDQFQSELENV